MTEQERKNEIFRLKGELVDKVLMQTDLKWSFGPNKELYANFAGGTGVVSIIKATPMVVTVMADSGLLYVNFETSAKDHVLLKNFYSKMSDAFKKVSDEAAIANLESILKAIK